MTSVAVVDLGSLSTRLLIADGSGPGRRRQVVTRMGEGVAVGGTIGDEALERVRAALVDFARDIDTAGVDRVAAVATAAARRARNADALAGVVEAVLGIGVDVLTAQDEGRLAFAGATADLGAEGPVLVLDIGGSSTEFSVGEPVLGVRSGWSADIGAGSLTEAYLESDPPTPWELSAALSVVELHIDDVIREVEGLGEVLRDGIVVGVGGTVTTVAAVELGLSVYDSKRIHGLRLGRDAVEDVFRTLATERSSDRAANPGLPPDRVELIVGGCCVLVEVMRRLAIDEVRVSERDLLDGVAAACLAER